MGLKCAIVGLPNVGKSSLFQALTRVAVGASNYPFCTIEPNIGVVAVPDIRLEALANIVNPEKVMPTYMEFVDVAGLVKGASQGEGLGNQFLANIRDTQAIAHVVRCFTDDNITHVSGQIDPINDIDIINTELVLADLATIDKRLAKIVKQIKTGDKQAIIEKQLLEKAKSHLDQGQALRTLVDLTEEEQWGLKRLQLLTAKPLFYIANVAEGEASLALLAKVKEIGFKEQAEVVAISVKIEAELSELDEEEQLMFLKDLGISEPGLNRVVRMGYQLLDLITYFTAGPREVRAWTIKRSTTAKGAAGIIHSDFEKGFIRAEVISYDDYIRYLGEQGSKDAGRLRLEGKTYIVCDGDIIHFRFNV